MCCGFHTMVDLRAELTCLYPTYIRQQLFLSEVLSLNGPRANFSRPAVTPSASHLRSCSLLCNGKKQKCILKCPCLRRFVKIRCALVSCLQHAVDAWGSFWVCWRKCCDRNSRPLLWSTSPSHTSSLPLVKPSKLCTTGSLPATACRI